MVRLVTIYPTSGTPLLINAAQIESVMFGARVTTIRMTSGKDYSFSTEGGPGEVLRHLFGAGEGAWKIVE